MIYTPDDIRFTYRSPYLYATFLQWPDHGRVSIQALRKNSPIFNGAITAIEVLGYDQTVAWLQTTEALQIETNLTLQSEYPVCLKLTID